MGLIKGILIYKYARRRADKRRDRQDAREQESADQEMQSGSWLEEICDYCGRSNEEHLDDDEPCS